MISFSCAVLETKNFNDKVGEYGQVEINDYLFLNKVDYRLTNYETSIININIEGEYTMYKDSHLFTGIFYKDIDNKKGDLKNVKYYIWEETIETKYHLTYEDTNCRQSVNGTEICDKILKSNESYQVTTESWIPYKTGTKLDKGIGKWKIEAERPLNKKIDFILEAHGKTFTEWAWLNSSWEYKREIPISENSDDTLTNYQVMLNITHNDNIQDGFGDIRFANSSQNAELDYWIDPVKTVNGSSAIVWVEVPSLSASTNTSIYMYYGNDEVSTTSNGNNTFLFYDDFEQGNLDNWETIAGFPAISSTQSRNGNTSVALDTDERIATINASNFEQVKGRGFYSLYLLDTAARVARSDWLNDGHSSYGTAPDLGTTNKFEDGNIYTTPIWTDLSIDYTKASWNEIEMRWNADTDKFYMLSNNISSAETNFGSATTSIDEFVIIGEQAGGVVYVDLVYVAKYTYTNEPTYSISGETPILAVNLTSPVDYYNSSTQDVSFECSATDEIGIYSLNLTIGNTIYETVTGDGTTNLTLSSTETLSDGDYTWYCTANDGTASLNSTSRTLTVDTTLPSVNITYLNGTQDYYYIGTNETLNWTASDEHIDACWYGYNGTNNTVTCGDNTTSFTLIENNTQNLTFYVNDTLGYINATLVEWYYKTLELNRTYNVSSYETSRETFDINILANSSLTAVTLDYNGTDYTTTQSGNIWSKAIDIPTGVQNNSFKWKLTYGDTINTRTTYQNISEIVFTLCNATYSEDYLNITFKDESDLSIINASLPTSTFEYYLGGGDTTKTYSLVNSTDNYNYKLCAFPDEVFHVTPYVQYKRDSDYPQRVWNPTVQDYNNTLLTQILYLLESADGIYVTIQVINSVDQLLSEVSVSATREIDGSDTVVATGTTGAAGTVTFWLNPDFSHDFALTKTGFTDYTTTFMPTQTSYTITLGATSIIQNSTIQGISYSILPTNTYLLNDTDYTFGFGLSSSYWDVEDYGFSLRLENGSVITGDNTGVEGTNLTKTYNTTNQTIIYLDYYWIINDVQTDITTYWIIHNTANTQWSIATFFTDLNLYLDSDIFGLDDFGRNLIIFLILFISVGVMSYKFGAASPLAISSLMFGIIFFFDVVVGLIPAIRGIENMLTFLSLLILVLAIFNEVRT